LCTAKKLSFDVKIAKIGPVDLGIIYLREIIKKNLKRRKKERNYRGDDAGLPSGLKNMISQ